MTSLIAWLAVDNRGPSSVYLASDSRFSGGGSKWDCGRKLFACKKSPDIFAYCGAVLFPTVILGQLDEGLVFSANLTPLERFETITVKIKESLQNFPEAQHGFSIVYATRDGLGFGASFFVATLTWQPSYGWQTQLTPTPDHSDLLLAYGSGATVTKEFHSAWQTSEVHRTSRAVFSAFCDAIASGRDIYSGGPPQLVGIYLRGHVRSFGVIHNGSCFLNGLLANPPTSSNIECRNSLFEPCDPDGKPNAQRHARPNRLKRS